jgi:hypothetical protein
MVNYCFQFKLHVGLPPEINMQQVDNAKNYRRTREGDTYIIDNPTFSTEFNPNPFLTTFDSTAMTTVATKYTSLPIFRSNPLCFSRAWLFLQYSYMDVCVAQRLESCAAERNVGSNSGADKWAILSQELCVSLLHSVGGSHPHSRQLNVITDQPVVKADLLSSCTHDGQPSVRFAEFDLHDSYDDWAN